MFGREGERLGEDYALRFTRPDQRGWMTLDSATADGAPARVVVEETLARVDLPRPIPPGDSVVIALRFTVQVPKPIARFGRVGEDYAVAQWYPKVCVYDEEGWHLDPYHYLSEFYGDFGRFDVAVTLPDPFWVGATGVEAGVADGDNEIPLLPARSPVDSVTVTLAVALADTLAGRWPDSLTVVTDLAPAGRTEGAAAAVPRGGPASLRVPRGAPVHYAYRWHRGKDAAIEEADREGRPGPLRRVLAVRDTSITDTLRALAPEAAPTDTVLPSMKTVRFHAERVHDFAWVASPEYVRDDTTWSGIRIRSLTFRDDPDDWRESKRYVVQAMGFLTERVGPYAWPSFTTSRASIGGGAMEYPMLIMNDADARSPWIELLDFTIAHEVAHSWFYGMLASDERAHPWLDEGFSHYLEMVYADTRYPDGLLRRRGRFPWPRPLRHFDDDEQSYLRRAQARDERPVATPADRQPGFPPYGVAAYLKPAMMLHGLRGLVGDSLFDAFLHEYYRRYRFRHPRPADVVRTAEDATGFDLEDHFGQWLGGTGRANYAVGGIQRGRDGALHRSMVTIRRTEAMVLPVVVEAAFADGTRQERRVLPRERETDVAFESAARLTRATIDPRHEIAEIDRLDNRSGLLPPIRLRPLYDFPTSEAFTLAYGPTLWHGREEGARVGLWTAGRYLASRDFPSGVRAVEGGLSVGTRGGSVAWRLGASRRVARLGARGNAAAIAVRDAGMVRGEASLSNWVTAPARRHPYRWWTVHVAYRDRYNLAPVDARYWSLGRAVHAEGSLRLETQGPRRREEVGVTLGHGFSAFRGEGDRDPDVQYDRAAASVTQTLDLLPRGDLHVTWRIFAGSTWRRVPRELRFDAAEESRLDAVRHFYLNDRGPVRSTGRYLHPGGGGLRGYHDRGLLGKRILAGSVEVELPWAGGLGVFVDGGRVEAVGLGESGGGESAGGGAAGGLPGGPPLGRALADAGLTLDVGFVRLTAPIWVSDPRRDERPWRLRWLVTLGKLPALP